MIEYRSATVKLKNILSKVSETEFTKIRDIKTTDNDCKSIQTVVSHCIKSGYTYANYIDSTTPSATWLENEKIISNSYIAIDELDKMLDYTQVILEKINHLTGKELEQFQN